MREVRMRGHGGIGAHVYSVLAIIISDDELKDPNPFINLLTSSKLTKLTWHP